MLNNMEALEHIKNKYKVDVKQSIVRIEMDRFRGFTTLLRELDLKVGAEIGVLKGLFSKWLMVKGKVSKLYLVDPYLGYDDYSRIRTQDHMNAYEVKAKNRLAKFNVEFVKKTSMEAVKDFEDESLDFVFIDANHAFEWVMPDIIEWSKKVKKGGIVSGHDYSDYHWEVREAVNAWVKVKKISPLFLIGSKVWFYVKQ
jgi:hypothetical protein